MKKMLMFLSSAVLILVLTVGCCLTAYGEATASPSATEAPETPGAEAGSDTLIAYFSWSGNTGQGRAAHSGRDRRRRIQDRTGNALYGRL